jgi:hypothetical protein
MDWISSRDQLPKSDPEELHPSPKTSGLERFAILFPENQ